MRQNPNHATLGVALGDSAAFKPSHMFRPWAPVLVFLIAFSVYANSIPNHFAYDDYGVIVTNPTVQHNRWTAVWNQGYWPKTNGMKPDILFRPLTILSYIMNHATTPHLIWPYHLVNVILFGLVSVLVTLLAWRLVRHAGVAVAAGLIFAVHPLHTEVVANVIGRAELLAAAWALSALLIYLPVEGLLDSPGPQRGWWHGFLVSACIVLALFCKETPAGLLCVFPIIDVWRWSNWPVEGRMKLRRWLSGQTLRYYLPIWLGFGLYMLLRLHAVGLMASDHMTSPIVNPLMAATLGQRIITPFMLLGKYVYLFFWPAHLSADYSAPSLMPTANLLNPLVLLGMGVFSAVVLAAMTYWRKNPPVALLCVLLAFSYGLVANVLRIGTIFGERLFFWPSVFLTILLCIAGKEFLARLPRPARARRMKVLAGALATFFVGAMVGRTVERNRVWHGNISLALATAQDNPDSARNCAWAGAVLLGNTRAHWMHKFGARLLRRAIRLYPSYPTPYWALAQYDLSHGRYGPGLNNLALAAAYRPGMTSTRWHLNHYMFLLMQTSPKKYLPDVQQFVLARPKSGTARFAYAMALSAAKKMSAAKVQLHKALALRPAYAEALAQLGLVQATMKEYRRAVGNLRFYVMHDPFDGEARCALAHALMQLNPKQFPTALAEAHMNLARAHVLLPHYPEVRQLEDLFRKKQSHRQTLPKVRQKRPSVAVRGDSAPAAI